MDWPCSEPRGQVLGNGPGVWTQVVPFVALVIAAHVFMMCRKKSGKNRRDLKELTQTMVEFIQAVHAVTPKAEGASLLEFQQMCSDFEGQVRFFILL